MINQKKDVFISINIFGQRLDCVNFKEVTQTIKFWLKGKKTKLIFASNIHNLLLFRKSKKLSLKYNQADLIFADGVPLIWLSKLKQTSLPERISGTDLVEYVLVNLNAKVFLLGSNDNVLQTVKRKYNSVVGIYSPPFTHKFTFQENTRIFNNIKNSRADILLVALTPPKQEAWLMEHLDSTGARIGIGIGSALDILSGNKPRSPNILRNNGFEWLWRVYLEPLRLGPRYITDFIGLTKVVIHYLISGVYLRIKQ